jgi:hypothetical protein
MRARHALTQRIFNVRLNHVPKQHDAEKRFFSALSAVLKIETVRFSNREMKLAVATIIQNAGYSLLTHTTTGEYLSLATRVMKAAVGKCSIFSADTQSTQLAKLIISLAEVDGVHVADIFDKSGGGLLSSMKSLITNEFFETDPHAYSKSEDYCIEKYPFLRHIKRLEKSTFDG